MEVKIKFLFSSFLHLIDYVKILFLFYEMSFVQITSRQCVAYWSAWDKIALGANSPKLDSN